ncbi:MAG: hypothetical protein GWN00_36040 [Aliifodinibius sp.]|nr:hypothetical protein [Fodinibius sp.]NIV16047.1 hypothetical protein [Fodinibius sp.]NIY30005.1 hypothetical protein [Fodinibius sp.]
MIRKLLHIHRFRRTLLNIVIILLSGIGLSVHAQAVIGARELAVGQATTALEDTDWGMFGNPALMSEDERSVSFFGVRYFGLAELTDMAFSGTYPTKFGVLGAGAHRYGDDLFNESRIRLGYKHSFAGFHFGAIINYSHVAMGGGYGSAGALGVDVGMAAPIVSDLWIGAKATNINQPEYGSLNNEKLPRELSIGLSYRLSDIALFTSDVVKDVQFPISYRGGVEVSIIENFVARGGITVEPITFSGGFGYSGDFWAVNVAVQRHENRVLGYSPAIDFKVIW